jgi:hypothetical protein
VLLAHKSDRGFPALSPADLDAHTSSSGFVSWFATSAREGPSVSRAVAAAVAAGLRRAASRAAPYRSTEWAALDPLQQMQQAQGGQAALRQGSGPPQHRSSNNNPPIRRGIGLGSVDPRAVWMRGEAGVAAVRRARRKVCLGCGGGGRLFFFGLGVGVLFFFFFCF